MGSNDEGDGGKCLHPPLVSVSLRPGEETIELTLPNR